MRSTPGAHHHSIRLAARPQKPGKPEPGRNQGIFSHLARAEYDYVFDTRLLKTGVIMVRCARRQ